MKQVTTLCVVSKDSKLLLGMKKRGFGAGRWNGFGGKVEVGEDIAEAMRRELLEEVGIEAIEIEKVGELHFRFTDGTDDIDVHIFHVTEFTGEPVETEEMEPDWFAYDEIPYSQMWAADEHWLPHVLIRQKFTGRFLLDRPATAEHASKIVEFDIDVVHSLGSSVPKQE